MAKLLSNRVRSLNVGISSFTENQTALQITGNVGIGTTLATVEVIASNTSILNVGVVTANYYYGDGSNLTNISVTGIAATVLTSNTAPTSPSVGDLWYYPTQGRLFVYFGDEDSSQWVDASPFNIPNSGSGANVSVGETAPSSPSSGDLWYNSDYGRLFVYFGDEDSSQWVDSAPFNFSGITTATYTENSFVATAGQTSFSVSYEVGYVDVYLNGIRLSSSEYTATNGSSIVLDVAATDGDVVDIIEVATNRGPTGPRGATGSGGPLENVTISTNNETYYPIFAVGVGTTTPYINTTSNYLNFNPSTGTLNVNQLNVSGIATATSFSGSGTNLTGIVTSITAGSGISINQSIGNVTITATGGDLGIATAGGTVGTGITLLDFRGSGISTVTFSSGTATINIEGGGGSSTPDISPVTMSMIF